MVTSGGLGYIYLSMGCSMVKHFRLICGAVMNVPFSSRNEGTLPRYHTIYHSIEDFPLFGLGSFDGRMSNNEKTCENPKETTSLQTIVFLDDK